jgi:hypothetical protein
MYTTRTPPRAVGPSWLTVASRAICRKYEDLPLLATLRNAFPRIVAPKVAGSSPVGHPRGEPVRNGQEGLKKRFLGHVNAIDNAMLHDSWFQIQSGVELERMRLPVVLVPPLMSAR